MSLLLFDLPLLISLSSESLSLSRLVVTADPVLLANTIEDSPNDAYRNITTIIIIFSSMLALNSFSLTMVTLLRKQSLPN